MTKWKSDNYRRLFGLAAVMMIGIAGLRVNAAVDVVAVQYQQDNPYPEYNCWYHYGNYPTSCGVSVTGVNAMVFLKNSGGSSATINDVTLGGYSLNTILERDAALHDSASIYYHWDDPAQDLFDVGEPIWYRADPNPIPAGGFARVVVRLRSIPVTQPISVAVSTSSGTPTTNVTVDASTPLVASIGFSTNRTKVYLHWRRNGASAAPTSIWLDGTNVTSLTTTVSDPSMNFAASVIELSTALPNMSYHVFQGVYADGKTATASLRVWVNRFLYGTWGVTEIPDDDDAAAQAWINECQNRGVNCYVNNTSGGLQDYLATGAGQSYAEAHDYGYVKDSTSWGTNPRMWFIDDEPDIEEGNISCGTGFKVPCTGLHSSGIMGLKLQETGEALRAANPLAPTTINLDGNFKPDGWFTYGQFADVMMMDSYYEGEQAGNHWDHPERDPLYTKPTSVYAAAIATTTASEPNPMHMILNAVEWKQDASHIWPFSPAAGKRIQAYYALAGGAKGMAYWWFKSGYPYNGLDDGGPEATALWKEIGLVGNEIKTAQPLLVTGHPVSVPLTPGTNVWARALAVGTDTMVVFAVNDKFTNTTSGTIVISSVSNAIVTITLPTWMQPAPTAFEISVGGLKAITTQTTNANQLQINLGTLSVTKMIVLTKDPLVPVTIQQRYNNLVRPNVCAFASEYCGNAAPLIVVPPQTQTVLLNSNALFTVVASGTPLPTYQWRFFGTNLAGMTSDTYTRTNAQVAHNGSYSVVVSNSQGVVTSAVATLTVSTNGLPPSIVTPPGSLSVEVGDNAPFTVTASGTAPLKYQWQYNGANIGGATTNSYTKSNAQLSDAGNYTVVVTNAAGAVTSAPGVLTVSIPCPAVGLLNTSFELGNSGGVATNWTSYQRSPNPTTVWSIQTASPPSGGGTQYQQIANTSSTGGGGVRQDITGCTVGATYSVAGWFRGNSGNSTVTVKVSPTASSTWSTATNLTPAATVTGSTWTAFGGVVVATSTSMTLWLDGQTAGVGQNNTACFDAIVVTCEEMPPPGDPPTITSQPSAQNLCAGGNATFSVTATGTGTITYQWQTNSVNLSNGSHYAGATAATLWVTNVSSSDAVNYRCVVSDANGSTNSSTAALTLRTATGFSQHPSATNVCSASNTKFSVVAVGDGAITYQWQTNSVNISNNSHYSGCTAATMWVTNVSSADAVNYRCVATAGCGPSTSFQGALTLRTATSVTLQPVSVAVSAGSKTNFTVAGTGDGTITYQWQTNSVNISNNSHYGGVTTTSLWVTNISSADAVNYRCVVTGGCGNANSSTATLTVCALPTLQNASFEGATNVNGVATNWFGYQRSPNPTTVWSIQTASPPVGGSTNYQQIANTSSTGGGGVRQDIRNCVIGATYTVAGWMRGNSGVSSTCTVKVSPTASTNWATAVNLSPAATFTGSTWTNFSGTVTATGTNMTLWLDGQTTSTGLNKAECFDVITVTCAP